MSASLRNPLWAVIGLMACAETVSTSPAAPADAGSGATEAAVSTPDAGAARDAPDVPAAPADVGGVADAEVAVPPRGPCRTDPIRRGCLEAPTLLAVNRASTENTVESFTCDLRRDGDIVRLEVCLSPVLSVCAEDAGVTFCAVIEVLPEAVARGAASLAFEGGASVTSAPGERPSLDESRIEFIPTNGERSVRRAWVRQDCACSADAPAAMQTLRGTLRLDAPTDGRVRGHVELTAEGQIFPVTWTGWSVRMDADFDLARPE